MWVIPTSIAVSFCSFTLAPCTQCFPARSSGRHGQFRTFSFFSMPDIWEKSGIHTSMWSNSAEQKFRSLIEKLNPQSDADSTTPIPVHFKTNAQ